MDLCESVQKFSSSVMVLGAGLGTRLHPLTLTKPKPLVRIGQETLLAYHLNHIKKAGLRHIVMNIHYKGDQITDYLKENPILPYTLSMEDRLLNTGGGVAKAMAYFDHSFFSINSDAYTNGDLFQKYAQLKDAFIEDTMDALLLVCPMHHMRGYEGKGDFVGELSASRGAPLTFCSNNTGHFVYVGLQLMNLLSFQSFVQDNYPEYIESPSMHEKPLYTPFSMMDFWKICHEKGRLFGCADHSMQWFDTGNVHGLSLARQGSKG